MTDNRSKDLSEDLVDNRTGDRIDGADQTKASAAREESRELATVAARAADDKGAQDIVILEVGDVLVVADHFVVASGANDRQVKAIVEEVERGVAEADLGKPLRVEGLDQRQWVLLDYGDVVVHVFLREIRDYYELERLWSDVPRVEWARTTVPS